MGIAQKLSESDRIRIAGELFKITRTDEHRGELHGLCPIHGEKNPSFSYNYREDLFHCFSCGADGDLCSLFSKVKGYDEKKGYIEFCKTYTPEGAPFTGNEKERQGRKGKRRRDKQGDAARPEESGDGAPEGAETKDFTALKFFDRGVNDRLSFKPRLLADHIVTETDPVLSDPSTGILYKWNGRYWETFNEDHISQACILLLGLEAQKSRIEDAVYQVKRLCTIPHGRTVNDKIDWICIENGMLNLRSLELRPHDPDFLATVMLPVSYDPESKKKCDRFLQYLDETVQTTGPVMQLQEFAGYCLTPSTAFEKCLLLLGPGADGKSTFLKILRELVGPENCAAVSFPDLEDQFQRSSLYGKLLNISTEVGAKAIESQYFKAITSGDPLNAAFKHRDSFEFCPTCKLAFSANRLPRVLDNSDGYFRRLLPVQFKRQFIDDYDPNLFQTMKGELSEIFSWAIEGLHRLWDQKGFTTCEETQKLMGEYRKANNPILCFVLDECEEGENYEVEKKLLYQRYRDFCRDNGFMATNRENFFRELYAIQRGLSVRQRREDDAESGEKEIKRFVKGLRLTQ